MNGQYEGLGAYASRERVDPMAPVPGESAENHRRRTAQMRRAAELAAQDEEATRAEWEAHRRRMDAPHGEGAGLFGRSTGQQRAAAVGRGMGGSQAVQPTGGLDAGVAVPGSVAIGRIYANQVSGDDTRPGSPLLAWRRDSNLTERWS